MTEDAQEEKPVTLQHPLKTILSFDVESLKKNIERHENNIKIFQEEIEKAKEQIALLKAYIEIIEKNKGKSDVHV